jgi:hypothetical protein
MRDGVSTLTVLISILSINALASDNRSNVEFVTIEIGSNSKLDSNSMSNILKIYNNDHWSAFWEEQAL